MPKIEWTYKDRKYSGPGRTGICVCGHGWEEHHISCVMNEDYYNATKEGSFPDECTYYGFNEKGGMKPIKRKGGKKTDEDGGYDWIYHCGQYVDGGIKKKKKK